MAKRTYRDRLIREMAKTPVFQDWLTIFKSERPYRLPSGFLSTDKFAEICTAAVTAYAHELHENEAGYLYSLRMTLWFLQDAPLYCVSPNLLKQLMETDIESNPSLLADITPENTPTLLFLLPKGQLQSPDGSDIDHIVFHVADREDPDASTASGFGLTIPYHSHKYPVNFGLGAINERCTCWFSGWGMQDGQIQTEDGLLKLSAQMDADELDWMAQMRLLVLLLLLVLKYEPELIEVMPQPRPRQNRKGQRSPQSAPPYRRPRILKPQPRRQITRKPHQGGTHASPRPYWKLLDPERNPRWKFRRWIRVNANLKNQ